MPSEDAAWLARLEELARLYTERPHVYAAASPEDLQRAADLRWAVVTIARLTAERDRLRTALVPFVEFGQSALAEGAGVWLLGESIPAVTWQFARAALAPAPAEGE